MRKSKKKKKKKERKKKEKKKKKPKKRKKEKTKVIQSLPMDANTSNYIKIPSFWKKVGG